VTIKLLEPVRAVLLDIEGTTTPIDFVYKVLFPFARERAGDFLTANATDPGVLQEIADLKAEHAADIAKGLNPPPIEEGENTTGLVEYIHWLMDQDRKSTPLKSLQGKIWEEGYRRGELRSQVFDDVTRAFKRWKAEGQRIYIYSSGSVLAQKLLFANTEAGDLTVFISGYFDTNTGAKMESTSYERIASSAGLPPPEIAFFSDAVGELDAARKAGMQTVLCLRPGNHPQPDSERYSSIRSFDELFA
jgi:enolase-phosphatase E1